MFSLKFNSTYDVSVHKFAILVNNTNLIEEVKDPLFQIDPSREPIAINITDIRSTLPTAFHPDTVTILDNVSVFLEYVKLTTGEKDLSFGGPFEKTCVDGVCYKDSNMTYKNVPPVQQNISLIIPPEYSASMNARNTRVFINLTFSLEDGAGAQRSTLFLPGHDRSMMIITLKMSPSRSSGRGWGRWQYGKTIPASFIPLKVLLPAFS